MHSVFCVAVSRGRERCAGWGNSHYDYPVEDIGGYEPL